MENNYDNIPIGQRPLPRPRERLMFFDVLVGSDNWEENLQKHLKKDTMIAEKQQSEAEKDSETNDKKD